MCFACILYLYISLASRRFVHAHWTYLYNGRKVGQLFSLLRTLLRRSLARSGPLWLEESSTSTQQVPPCQLFSLHTSCGQLDHSPAGETRRAVTWAAMLPGRKKKKKKDKDKTPKAELEALADGGIPSDVSGLFAEAFSSTPLESGPATTGLAVEHRFVGNVPEGSALSRAARARGPTTESYALLSRCPSDTQSPRDSWHVLGHCTRIIDVSPRVHRTFDTTELLVRLVHGRTE